MKRAILYIIIAFFCLFGCEPIELQNDVITDIEPPEPVIVHEPVFEPESTLSVNKLANLTTQPTSPDYEDNIEVTDEDEQIKRIIVTKIRNIYNENRTSIKMFLVEWICIIFGSILGLYWIVRCLNLLSPSKLGFTLVWIVLVLSSIICVLMYL